MKRIGSVILLLSVLLAGCIMSPADLETPAMQTAVFEYLVSTAATRTAMPQVDTAETTVPSRATGESPTDCTYRAQFVQDVSIPDRTVLNPGQEFVKTWRMKNTGTCDWGAGVVIRYSDGAVLSDHDEVVVPAAAASEVVDVSVPMRAPDQPGTYRSYWRLATPAGRSFGPAVYVLIVVEERLPTATRTVSPLASQTATPVADATPAPTRIACPLSASFLGDVTIPDDTVLRPGEPFIKTWRFKNNGACDWPAGVTLQHVAGTRMSVEPGALEEPVSPGETVDLAVPMRAATTPGTHVERFRLCEPDGDYCFGTTVYVRIIVRKGAFLGPAKGSP